MLVASIEERYRDTVVSGLDNTHRSHGQEENAEVLERDAAVLIDIPKQEKEDARLLNEDANFSGVEDKDEQRVGKENMEEGEELPAHNDVVVSEPDNEGKEHNVDVEPRHVEQKFETHSKELVVGNCD
ncbi:hypothetical protein BC332_18780 [Capsicum chinense]|nr:hypothetical protein BC332_18780 [Capsicum chinense]